MRLHMKRIIYWIPVTFISFLTIYLGISKYSKVLFFKYLDNDVGYVKFGRHQNAPYGKGHLQRSSVKLAVNNSPAQERAVLWPSREYYSDDRILNQLSFKVDIGNVKDETLKIIYVHGGLGGRHAGEGRGVFLEDKCLVNTCEIVRNINHASSADALIFVGPGRNVVNRTSPKQIKIIFLLESPYHSAGLRFANGEFNWTATYRHDSDIVAPYEKFVRYNESVKFLPQNKNYAEGKTKLVAWFVSNCHGANGRMDYARELSKYIAVDIYGTCGTLRCPRNEKHCFEMLDTDYKFYLSFENSNCRDYITEKFFVTGLQHDVIPIAMGAAPEDYARAAPPNSFIHVDDFKSPKELAEYLHTLDQNDDLYNEYFRWKGTGSFINTFFWCRICAMLHETSRESHAYRDLEKWWRGDGVCIGKDNWRQRQRTSKYITEDYLL